MDKSLNCIIRPLRSDETFLLKDFLYEAISFPEVSNLRHVRLSICLN